ncbi:hypothetical protein B7494_g6650 [Chlorociboria aeruginascens]|nr:hypothetical protein B7494_g6650 [Chlorociboria aeruginascens]
MIQMAARSTSRDRSVGEPPEDASRVGTKRLFSHRDSRQLHPHTPGDGTAYANLTASTAEDAPAGKRHRSSDWPLANTTPSPQNLPGRSPLRIRNAPNSPPSRRPSSSQARPSKFVEGSMNDRASQRPPSTYTGTEEALQESYECERNREVRPRKIAQPKRLTHHPNLSVAESFLADKSEAARNSSIFRFGKSLAASFNPSNWKIWSKQQRESDDETSQRKVLQERQEKAARVYQELKKSGQLRDGAFGHYSFQGVPEKHDSGMKFGSLVSLESIQPGADISVEEKRKGRVFLEHSQALSSGESPASTSLLHSNASSVQRQSFHLKRTSTSNLHESQGSDHRAIMPDNQDHQVRRLPSRKDLQKQQKLVKRVSDLEGKLEAARRQLSEALGEPVPYQPMKIGRPRFVPGALSSLPSERLLSGYVSSDACLSDSETHSGIGKAMTTNHPVEDSASIKRHNDTNRGELSQSGDQAVSSLGPNTSTRFQAPEVQDEVLQSVEIDSISERPGSKPLRTSQVKAFEDTSEVPSEKDTTDNEEPISARKAVNDSLTRKPSRKRRSNFERIADDGGKYKYNPSSASESEMETRMKGVRRMKAGPNRPRKLQKTTEEAKENMGVENPLSIPDLKNTSSQNQQKPAPRYGAPPTKGILPTNTATSRRLSKTQIPSKISRKGVQAASSPPPPSSEYTGLNYAKPSNRLGRSSHTEVRDSAYSVEPTTEGDVPPLPPMPKAVRLASGEIISTASASVSTKTKPESKNDMSESGETKGGEEDHLGVDGSYEWPEDIF